MWRRRLCVLLLSIVLLSVALVATAQDEIYFWIVSTVEPLTLPEDYPDRPEIYAFGPFFHYPAPDARQMVYQRYDETYETCIFDVLTGDEQCYATPWMGLDNVELGSEAERPLRWSPDSTRLALVGDPIRFGHDPDLVILDTTDGSMTTLLEDNVSAGSEDCAGQSIEVLPAWSPGGDALAFARYVRTGDDCDAWPGPFTIAVLDLFSGELRDLGPLPASAPDHWWNVISLEWSPAGAILAAVLSRPDGRELWL
ncbi:MAG: hypothetical protein JW910_21165, partial [Anaerolineae bacterium]|nr:hypothetical protein [Anaerolineae bacterium]